MKVFLFPASYPPVLGGVQAVSHTLARSLKNQGHDVRVITNRYPRALKRREILDGISIMRWHFLMPRLRQLLDLRLDLFLGGLFYFPLTLTRLIILLLKEKPDVVNLHFVSSNALFVLLARTVTAFRLVVSLHGYDVEGLAQGRYFDVWLFRALLRRADVVTACSQYLLDEAVKIEPAAERKGLVIHNGMDQLPELSASSTNGVVVGAGRMVLTKGFDVLLKAHAACGEKGTLTLIGDGPERPGLERLAKTLGLNGQVRFSGQQDRASVLAQIAASALVVIPSRYESFGLVALEAMALGKPVVATRVGGLPEILEGADAFLLEPENPVQLAKAIETALDRIKRDPGFGQRNRKCAARFSTQRMVEMYVESYR